MPCNSHSSVDKACKACHESDDDDLQKTDDVAKNLAAATASFRSLSKAMTGQIAQSLATATTRQSAAIDEGIIDPAIQDVSGAKMQASLVLNGVPGGRIIPHKIAEQFESSAPSSDYASCLACGRMVLEGESCLGCARLSSISGMYKSTNWSR